MQQLTLVTEFPLNETLIASFLLEGKTMIFVLSRFIQYNCTLLSGAFWPQGRNFRKDTGKYTNVVRAQRRPETHSDVFLKPQNVPFARTTLCPQKRPPFYFSNNAVKS